MLGLRVYLADILADNAEHEQLKSAERPHGCAYTRPSRDGMTCRLADDAVDKHCKAHEQREYTESCGNFERSDAERSYSLKGEREHLFQRIF